MPKKFSKPHMSRVINGDVVVPLAPEAEEKLRLDMALLVRYPGYNRSVLQKYIRNGQVRVNGVVVSKANTLVGTADELDLLERVMPKRPEVPVIYEDENVLVMDKPVGLLSVSKGDFNPEPTMADYGMIVHRLDRDTSGVMILAKNEETRGFLQRQFQERKVHKVYYAVVVGRPELAEAVVDVPLKRNLKKPTTFLPDAEGREAITQYRVMEVGEQYSLLELRPRTGRMHQLRVHLKHVGTPILGDAIYGVRRGTCGFDGAVCGSGGVSGVARDFGGVSGGVESVTGGVEGATRDSGDGGRMFLHAGELEITIPGGIRKVFRSKMPGEFRRVLRED